MADGAYVYIREDNTKTVLQQTLEKIVNDEETRRGINEILLKQINKYVPKGETGELRRSAYATSDAIIWPQEYAHYQFVGTVYGPNFRVIDEDSGELMWKAPKGEGSKYPTERHLGWYAGYSEPGTGADWANEMWANERGVTNLRITKYMQRRIRELGL